MKLRNVLLTFGLALCAGASIVAKLGADNVAAKETNATTWINWPSIYFVPSDKWAYNAKSFKVIAYDDKGQGNLQNVGDYFVNVAESNTFDGRNVYKIAVTHDGVSHIQFCSYSDSNWTNQIYYSDRIALPDGFSAGNLDTFVMDAKFDGENNWHGSSTSTDGVYTYSVGWMNTANNIVIKKSFECNTASASTTRIFVHNSGTHWTSHATLIRAWGGSADVPLWNKNATAATLYNPTWFQDDDNTYYGYVDLPVDITGYQLVAYSAENARNATLVASDYYSNVLTFGTGYVNGVIYTQQGGNNVTIGAAKSTAGVKLMTLVCEAVDTCEEGTYNGWGAYTNLNNNFYSKATSDAKAAEVMTMGGKTGYTVDDHFAFLLTNYQASQGLAMTVFGFTSNSSTLVITIVVAATLVAFAAFFMVKRSKEN